MLFGRERSGRQLSRPANTMSSGGSLLLLLLLFWGDFALFTPVTMYTDYFEGNCALFPDYERRCEQPEYRFFYNVISKRCERYVDYGCPFRSNRFNTTEQCEEYCAPKMSVMGFLPHPLWGCMRGTSHSPGGDSLSQSSWAPTFPPPSGLPS
ncbi:kunitz-type protease inhibitor 4 [Crotalus adamanteus]|uniref:Kunitz-type protease inhibitor 4 n=1 Tax=Crotalus adamanteus TaxID=8729 RepID=A0AAW1BSG4_CROAD